MGKVTKVTVTIETTNAAFDDNFEQEVLNAIMQVKIIDGWKLSDSNGNTVGTVEVETE